MVVGRALYLSELAFASVWSVAEVAVACLRRDELPPCRRTRDVLEDLSTRGFYVDVPERPALRERERPRGEPRMVVAEHPYRYVTHGRRVKHRVVARLCPPRDGARARRLLVVFHCYGIPWPGAMSAFFGLDGIPDTDVAYAVMNHHQRGGYPFWPGTGFASASPACMLENLRAAVAGARTLVRALRHAREYDHVTVLGYSIGGQLALHLANTESVDRVVLYCPVVSVERVARELGLMGAMHPWLMRFARLLDPTYAFELLSFGDPLRHPLAVPEERIDVVAQRNDAMTKLDHVASIREKYPRVGWHELDGTHVVPFGRARVREIIRGA